MKKNICLFIFLVLSTLCLSVTASQALTIGDHTPGMDAAVLSMHQNYSDVARVTNRAYARQTNARIDSSVGTSCLGGSLGMTSNLGGSFSDVLPKFVMPPDWVSMEPHFNNNLDANAKNTTVKGMICSGGVDVKLSNTFDAAIDINMPCTGRSTFGSKIGASLVPLANNHASMSAGTFSSTGLNSIPNFLPGLTDKISACLVNGVQSALQTAIDTVMKEAYSAMAQLSVPDINPLILMMIKMFILEKVNARSIICNPDGILSSLKTLLDDLMKVKCRSIGVAWDGKTTGAASASVKGMGVGDTKSLTTNEVLKGTTSGGSRFIDELGKPVNSQILSKAKADIDAGLTQIGNTLSWPKTPLYSASGSARATVGDIINSMNQP